MTEVELQEKESEKQMVRGSALEQCQSRCSKAEASLAVCRKRRSVDLRGY